MEVMSMYVMHNAFNVCRCLRFTLFDYATKDFIYQGIYDQLEYINDFDVYQLLELSKKKLDMIGFERHPFSHHISCM